MSNSRRSEKPWLHTLGLCPLLVIDLEIVDTLLLGAALLVTLTFTNTAMTLLRRRLAEQQRLVATVLLAALSTGIIDLLMQAAYYQHAQTLQLYLPLAVIVPLLFYKADIASKPSPARALLDALMYGGAFAATLAIVALLRAPLPSEIGTPFSLICGGLLLALVNKFAPPPNTNEAPPTARTRARVTGPVR